MPMNVGIERGDSSCGRILSLSEITVRTGKEAVSVPQSCAPDHWPKFPGLLSYMVVPQLKCLLKSLALYYAAC